MCRINVQRRFGSLGRCVDSSIDLIPYIVYFIAFSSSIRLSRTGSN